MVLVELAVYDLSNGMASQLSEAILGQRIDGIWHTGVVVYGREYFFGGGIQNLPTGSFTTSNGLRPCQMLPLGDTNKTRAELEAYLRSINHEYTQATYDLINHNCNNFSNTVALFLLNTGIPNHIVDLPRIVFSTPGGMMLRPMIESMQSGISQNGGGGMDPFGAAAGGGGGGGLASLSSSNSYDYSGSTATTTATTVTPLPSSSSSQPPAQVVTTTTVRTFTPTPEEKPFVSADIDPNTLKVLCNKILNYNYSDESEGAEAEGLNAEEKAELIGTVEALGTDTLRVFPHRTFVALARLVQGEQTQKLQMACLFLLRLLALHLHLLLLPPTQESLLSSPSSAPEEGPTACGRGTPAYAACQVAVWQLLDMVRTASSDGNSSDSGSGSSFSSNASLVMAVCTLANLVSSPAGCDLLFRRAGSSESEIEGATEDEARVGSCVDVCAWGLSHSKPEVRQMSATLAYNLALASTRAGAVGTGQSPPHLSTQSILITQDVTSLPWRSLHIPPPSSVTGQDQQQREEGEEEEEGEELHQHIVQLLCAVLETVEDETDAVSLGRKLHAAYFVCVAGGAPAAELVAALGFDEHLTRVRVRDTEHTQQQQPRPLLTHMDRSRLGNFELLLHGP